MEVDIHFLNEETDMNWGVIKEFALVLFLLKTTLFIFCHLLMCSLIVIYILLIFHCQIPTDLGKVIDFLTISLPIKKRNYILFLKFLLFRLLSLIVKAHMLDGSISLTLMHYKNAHDFCCSRYLNVTMWVVADVCEQTDTPLFVCVLHSTFWLQNYGMHELCSNIWVHERAWLYLTANGYCCLFLKIENGKSSFRHETF